MQPVLHLVLVFYSHVWQLRFLVHIYMNESLQHFVTCACAHAYGLTLGELFNVDDGHGLMGTLFFLHSTVLRWVLKANLLFFFRRSISLQGNSENHSRVRAPTSAYGLFVLKNCNCDHYNMVLAVLVIQIQKWFLLSSTSAIDSLQQLSHIKTQIRSFVNDQTLARRQVQSPQNQTRVVKP